MVKNKFRKVWVSDNSIEKAIKDKAERYIISENENGSCVCISLKWAKDYEEGNRYNTAKWHHFAEIPESKTRPMTQEECIIWACTEGSSGWVVMSHQDIGPPANWMYATPDIYQRAPIIDGKIGEWQKFEVEDDS